MRFFTLDVYHDSDDQGLLFALHRYAEHLKSMRGLLPDNIVKLGDLCVRDGLLVKVVHDRQRRVLTLTLLCGDLQVGYFDMELAYVNAFLSRDDDLAFGTVAQFSEERGSWCKLDYQEVDRARDGSFEHSLLFFPGVALTIRFSSVTWTREARQDRVVPNSGDRYPGRLSNLSSRRKYLRVECP